jgi:hypothetical protein
MLAARNIKSKKVTVIGKMDFINLGNQTLLGFLNNINIKGKKINIPMVSPNHQVMIFVVNEFRLKSWLNDMPIVDKQAERKEGITAAKT